MLENGYSGVFLREGQEIIICFGLTVYREMVIYKVYAI